MVLKCYLVIGLAKSGVSASNLLLSEGHRVLVYDKDKNKAQELKNNKIIGENAEIINKLCTKTLRIVDCIVISPGVKLNKKLNRLIKIFNIEIMSELNLGAKYCQAPIIAITGTNGKTTTTQLTAHIFETNKEETHMAGNIGIPLSSIAKKISSLDKVICEVSSFQTEYAKDFSPKIVAFLNIAPDHLDRYKNFEEYFNAKKNILQNINNNLVILNYDDEKVRKLQENLVNVQFFSIQNLPSEYNGVFVKDEKIYYQKDGDISEVINIEKLSYTAKYNLKNILVAVLIAVASGVDNSVIATAINSFIFPSHRFQKVNQGFFTFINDSKATNIHSVLSAVQYLQKSTTLLLGGQGKGENYKNLFVNLPPTIKNIITFGDEGGKMYKVAKKFTNCAVFREKGLKKAFELATKISIKNSIILLSPACASFDEFNSYSHRGEYFIELVKDFVKNKKSSK